MFVLIFLGAGRCNVFNIAILPYLHRKINLYFKI